MNKFARAAAIAAGGALLAGCIPAAAVPVLQLGAAMAVDLYCAPATTGFRGDVREAFYGDRSTTVVGRPDCGSGASAP